MTEVAEKPVHPAFRAAEIALVAIAKNRCETWEELVRTGVEPRLTDEQLALVREYEQSVVSFLSVQKGAPVTLTWCKECDKVAFIGTGTVPTKCTLTLGCVGKAVKAGAPAPRTKAAATDEAPAEAA
ncbi:hypothetical protein [Leifsonia sp. Leaf264]|uniref:hypothetical protein n=1 Tax=Leifsonia sp. Leaf264 TaxID=1736314 RepID=UPI0006FFB95A|nr:hypothetical protein [Leifsonia sp. Leaf264]KQO98850.1 hypothetical protein ASF30_12370 [Leifsonia sp. Leaf264]